MLMGIKQKYILTSTLVLLLAVISTYAVATHISKPVLVEPITQYTVGEKVVINGWVDYNAQPTADVLLNFQVTTEDGVVIVEKSFPSDKQGHFHFEFDSKDQPPGTYKIVVTSQCLEIHRSICSYNSETLIFNLNNP
ncbi:MAG: hypothetical protein H6936_07540 [Burkholderiales bacterium]|nr:hypothetical protein [Nitrosomonas sp.]MCP5274693.1 hypothetical protein [Burkholderiales bacterium]